MVHDRYTAGNHPARLLGRALAEGLFTVFMVCAILVTWPAPPWRALFIAGGALMLGAPFLLYPISKSLWLAFDLFLRADDLTTGTSTREHRIEPPSPTA